MDEKEGRKKLAEAQWSKEARQADAIQATADHAADAIAVEKKTERLRALRLEKEAADQAEEEKRAAAAPPKKRKTVKKKKPEA
jgi:hypothetical protein